LLGLVDRNYPVCEIVACKIMEIGATGASDPIAISDTAVRQLSAFMRIEKNRSNRDETPPSIADFIADHQPTERSVVSFYMDRLALCTFVLSRRNGFTVPSLVRKHLYDRCNRARGCRRVAQNGKEPGSLWHTRRLRLDEALSSVAALYLPNAKVLPPTHEVVSSPATIEKFFAGCTPTA
jgi:hypothetical protein